VEDDYFKGVNAAVDTAKCNVCHDVLASSFHSESGRGGDGIELCKNCHNVTYAGSHLEMASRSIDSYVHAIHSFQAFDPGDVFETFDPVYAKRYDLHIRHTFPNFTIRNCEACHTDASFGNVPEQSQSMPSLLSSSDTVATWYTMVPTAGIPSTIAEEDPSGRNIGDVPQYVTGAASRACGGCHRARFIRDDAAGDLAAWNAHTEAFGTLLENSEPDDAILYGVIDKIMSLFE
jgi:OmcA/MtrC family decaheme c-type cytochrome